jgi:hypothetical protein
MNKAFVREPDQLVERCPRCGSPGQPVRRETIRAYLPAAKIKMVADPANFCPSPQCDVVYFDVFERVVLATDLSRPVYPKDPAAPICACFGLTAADIEQDVRQRVVARLRAIIEKANSPEARCWEMAANGQPCTAAVQKYYLQCKSRMEDGSHNANAQD